jgi:hypothetical protein
MGESDIQVGDRVINLQVPGIFTVVDRRGTLLVIETDRGLRMTMLESGVRHVDESGAAPIPSDTPEDS